MKMTLLEMTQRILSSMDSDTVNSITDTAESVQVADIVRSAYFDIISSLKLPEHEDLFEITATSSDTPVIMTLPSNVLDIEWIKYDNKLTSETGKKYTEVYFVPLEDFIDSMHALNGGDSDVTTFTLTTNGSDTMDILCRNDLFPSKWTTFNDNTIIFDSYNSAEDSFLQKNKTIAYGQLSPTWTHIDSFTPDLDAKQFTLLFNEAKGQAFIELKQTVNAKAEKRARRGWIVSQGQKRALPGQTYGELHNRPNYGRK